MTSTADENAALARRYLADVVAAGDRRATDAFLADGAQVQDLVFAGCHLGWPRPGDELAVDVHDVIATRDRVAVRGSVRGRPPDGGCYQVPGGWFYRIEDGRIAELRSLPDGLGLLRETGALGPPSDTTNSEFYP